MSVYSDACSETNCHRTNDSAQPISFFIKMGEIGSIIAANPDGIDAIRGYVGQDATGKKTLYFVGAVKDAAGNYNDVNIATSIYKARPCPTACGATNALNS